MYNSQDIAQRIKLRAKQQDISINQLLLNCGLGKNTILKMTNGTDILTQNFAKIADYLDCSVDYLLGRSDDTHMLISNAKDNAVAISQSGSATATIKNGKERELTKQEQDLLRIYNNATTRQQIKLMDYALSIEEEISKNK